jgi:hypothetical protein
MRGKTNAKPSLPFQSVDMDQENRRKTNQSDPFVALARIPCKQNSDQWDKMSKIALFALGTEILR